MAVAAVAIPAAAPSQATAALPTKGASYGHFRDNDLEGVELDVGPRGRALELVNIYWELRCSNGREVAVDYVWDLDRVAIQGVQPARVRIRRDGRFSATFAEPEPDLEPFVISEKYWLSGRFIRRGNAVRLVMRIRQVGEGGTICERDLHVTARRDDGLV